MDNKERFISLCLGTNRSGMEDLLEWLENSDFYTCPASTKSHGNHAGGLLEHSLNVYDELQRLLRAFPEVKVREDSAVISALLHDLCKVNFYAAETRNRKVDGRWETYDSYAIREKFPYGGHGSKSVFLAQSFIKLTPEEAVAINCHMGAWDGNPYIGTSYEKFPFAWLLHVADEAAAYIDESTQAE